MGGGGLAGGGWVGLGEVGWWGGGGVEGLGGWRGGGGRPRPRSGGRGKGGKVVVVVVMEGCVWERMRAGGVLEGREERRDSGPEGGRGPRDARVWMAGRERT